MVSLRPAQLKAYKLMESGENVFITGMAGTGKTLLIKQFTQTNKYKRKIGLTSTTGTSAVLLKGSTLHSFLGIGLGKAPVYVLMNKMKANIRKRWCELDTLIIDEVSMLTPELFDKIEQLARTFRMNDKPFGGIQLILTGDFCQLPCIDSDEFCNTAKSWDKCIQNVVYLTEIIRQDNKEFQECLNNIRVGNITPHVKEFISSRINFKLDPKNGIIPTKLFSRNYSVDKINEYALKKMGKHINEYKMHVDAKSQTIKDNLVKSCNAPQVLKLSVGAQVILLTNLDVSAGLCNGSRGIVTGFDIDTIPIVKFLNGLERKIELNVWEIEEDGVVVATLEQFPLRLAYALSIHKCQGTTLDYVELDLSNIFEYGQAYVALSRVKNIDGLSITGIDFSRIQAHPYALEFYEKYNHTLE
jgi:ATP-dependent DNA helicase PIF1